MKIKLNFVSPLASLIFVYLTKPFPSVESGILNNLGIEIPVVIRGLLPKKEKREKKEKRRNVNLAVKRVLKVNPPPSPKPEANAICCGSSGSRGILSARQQILDTIFLFSSLFFFFHLRNEWRNRFWISLDREQTITRRGFMKHFTAGTCLGAIDRQPVR